MIGQKHLQKQLKGLIEQDKLTSCVLLVGSKGSGKQTLIKELFSADRLIWLEDSKIDSIRKMIELAYKVHNKIFVVANIDSASLVAGNALLKIIEEMPNNNTAVLTAENLHAVLDTIKSRSMIFTMDSYTIDEIYQYAKEYTNYTLHDDEWDIIQDVCETPGEVNTLGKYPKEFYDYVQLVAENIAEVSLANVFKIPDKVSVKAGTDGYDLKLFWKAFLKTCFDDRRFDRLSITADYLNKLQVVGINRQMLFDSWLLKIWGCG